jgi:excisionase family DNA binding protein
MVQEERMLTPEEVAERYGVAAQTVRGWCARGRIRAIKEGDKYRGNWLIPESALEGWTPPRPGRPKRK